MSTVFCRLLPAAAAAAWLTAFRAGAGGLEITYPDHALDLPESAEFAGLETGKPWDMSELYDITYRYGFHEPFTPPAGGIWRGRAYDQDLPAHFHPLFRGIVSDPDYLQYFTRHAPGTPYGPLNPVNADAYNRLSFRHALNAGERSYCQITWHHTLLDAENNYLAFYDGDYARASGANLPVPDPSGFRIYDLDLAGAGFGDDCLPYWDKPGSGGAWTGTVYGFYIVPSLNAHRGMPYAVDWIRLYRSDPATRIPLAWTAGTLHPQTNLVSLQLYVATNNCGDPGDLFLSGIANDGALEFHAGALPPGEYYLYLKAVLDTGSGFNELARSAYSPQLRINARPTFVFTAPSFTSGVEYAAAERGNPWDMNDTADIDTSRTTGIAGTAFNQGSLCAATANGDPQIALSLLRPDGAAAPIPTARYRYLTFRMQFDPSDYPSSDFDDFHERANILGGVARWQWVYTDFAMDQSYTKDLILHEGWNDYTVDLWDPALLETRNAPPSAGWTNVPAVNYLIFHPLEPSVPMPVRLDWVKLCAPNAPDNHFYELRWNAGDAEGEALDINLLYGRGAGDGFEGTAIVRLTNQTPGPGAFTWYTGAVPAGEYTLRAVVSDGCNTLTRDAPVPLQIGPPAPRLPAPVLKGNGLRNSLALSAGETLTVTVELDAGDYAGLEADWWVAAWDAGQNLWYYLDAAMLWTTFDGNFAACRPVYQGPLFHLPPTAALSDFPLPPGSYYFYFAVDERDDSLNYPAGPIVFDDLNITVAK